MKKIRLDFAYDGTEFRGFQRQSTGRRTVQGEMERVLSRLTGEEISFYGSGRTDAGVHARGQVGHFETRCAIPAERLAYILNHHLPPDIVVHRAEEVPCHFHARHDVVSKTYCYWVDTGPAPDLFLRRFSWHIRRPLNLDAMQKGARMLTGTHDFTAFSSARSPVLNRVRTIYDLSVKRCKGYGGQPLVIFTVKGSGFLYHMVRILVGTLLEVGLGERTEDEVREILESRDRTRAGITAPPQGLILWEVHYA